MDVASRLALIKKPPTVEIVTEEDLIQLLETKSKIKHYIGFEISGYLHLGTLMGMMKIRDLEKAGIETNVFLADYHAWINKKLGNDLELIRKVAKEYFIEMFKAFDLSCNFILASEIYDNEYWRLVIEIMKNTTIKRMLRAGTIMGRKEEEMKESAFVLYPALQAADIFFLDVDIAHGGLDQRKVHMLARELAQKLGKKKFVALHHSLLSSLQGGERMDTISDKNIEKVAEKKMSKSKPESAIFLHDSEEEIRKKIRKAYCPAKVVEGNPIIDIAVNLILRDGPLKIERDKKYGGDITIETAEELISLFADGKIHPLDLKNAVANYLVELLKPFREKHRQLGISLEITR